MGVGRRACKACAGGARRRLAAAAAAAELGRMQTRAERIRDALQAAFPPAEVQVRDASHRHAGHAGARPEGETHYSVLVVSPAFAGMARVARSRAAHAALEREFGAGLHALSLRLLTPEEVSAA